MADYYPLVARAVSGLDRNTGEARRALYERARTALVAQLRGVTPPLDEAEITRERLSLEEAIRKVEGEAARRPREAGSAAAQKAPRQPATAEPSARPAQAPMQRPAPATPPARPPQQPAPSPQPSPSLSAEGLKGFRTGVGLGDYPEPPPAPSPAAAPPRPQQQPPRRPTPPSRDPLAGLPTAFDFDQHQPVLDPETLHHPDAAAGHDYGAPPPPPAGRSRPQPPAEEEPRQSLFALGPLIKIAISVVIVIVLGVFAYSYRHTLVGIYQAFRGSPAPVARDARDTAASQARPKISDRVGASGTAAPQAGQGAPAVAQRVVLYEEEANDPQGKRYIGSVIWKTETVSPGQGKPPELAVRADVEIPERRMNMTFSLRRNTDPTLPASHTVEIMFNLPADFAPGGISNVPGLLMKQAEQTRGTPLAGLAVKVTSGFFLIGLSAVEADRQRNIELLKERAWFDIPIVYQNNRRAILALEKGTPGERAFAEAFAAWKQ
ncbi:MAG TPA: hypothetical protein VFB20_04180 [Burkholderiales bacterium]|nr:hypothetical protein [Burkholderiales bacterium]